MAMRGAQWRSDASGRCAGRFAKFGSVLHPDETRLIGFGRFASDQKPRKRERRRETFDFPGFTHCRGTNRNEVRAIRLAAKNRMRATVGAIRDAHGTGCLNDFGFWPKKRHGAERVGNGTQAEGLLHIAGKCF
jgi:hypothetical protein